MQFSRLAPGQRLVLLLILCGGTRALAADAAETIPADLPALIRAAAGNTNQFAVNVPHRVSTTGSGQWTVDGGTHVWTYAARIPGAVSLSFHSPRTQLPAGAILTVRSAHTAVTYRSGDVRSGDFWSRVQPGDTLEIELEIPAAVREQLVLEISSFQAGFRGLSRSVPDHPEIQLVGAFAAGDPDTPCVENYACHVTPANSPAAQATVALLVSNLYQCTGTLINNMAGDNTPYVLTARHCQNGMFGGGAPDAAHGVTVYWNAISSCGTPLDSKYYAPETRRQSGATTVVEQQDAWLIRLAHSPVVDDAQLAGFDASGTAFSGGYSIHHSLGYTRQFTRWFGTPVATAQFVQDAPFLANFLETVKALGTFGPGASGAGLYSQDDRLTGVLSLARRHGNQSGYGSCPAAAPSAPDSTNADAFFASLAAIWNSTADSTSSTGAVTLRSVLDPENTGALAMTSMPATRLHFTASRTYAPWNTSVTLTWSAANATQCTALEGSAGWSGTMLPGSGSVAVTHSLAGDVTYAIRCEVAGAGHVSGSLRIRWAVPNAQPSWQSFTQQSWITRPVNLAWQAVLGPCALTGGGLSHTDLPASGSIETTSATPADVTYSLTCGAPGFTSTIQRTVSYVTPGLAFAATGTRRRIGQPLRLAWHSLAESCVPSGGSPDDQWSAVALANEGTYIIRALDTPGSYTYGLTCTAGALAVQKSVTVTVDDAAPFVTLIPDRTTVTHSNSPADHITIAYSSNLPDCFWTTAGVTLREPPYSTLGPQLNNLPFSEGTRVIAPNAAGTLTVTLTCRSASGTPAQTVADSFEVVVLPAPPPTATLTSSAAQVAMGMPFTISWSSGYTLSCRASGGGAAVGGQWIGSIGTSGSIEVDPPDNIVTDAVYSISCPSIDPSHPPAAATVLVTIGSPNIALMGSTSVLSVGQSFTLTWNEPNASSCSAGGGGASGSPWSGALATSGTATFTASVSGRHTYELTCVVNGSPRTAQFSVNVAGAGNPGGGGGGGTEGGGGGGAIPWWELLALLLMAMGMGHRKRLCPSPRVTHSRILRAHPRCDFLHPTRRARRRVIALPGHQLPGTQQ